MLSYKCFRKKIEAFLTAKFELTDFFVSYNRELIKAIADFECLTPDVSKNISNSCNKNSLGFVRQPNLHLTNN